jgi:hypothetical protein
MMHQDQVQRLEDSSVKSADTDVESSPTPGPVSVVEAMSERQPTARVATKHRSKFWIAAPLVGLVGLLGGIVELGVDSGDMSLGDFSLRTRVAHAAPLPVETERAEVKPEPAATVQSPKGALHAGTDAAPKPTAKPLVFTRVPVAVPGGKVVFPSTFETTDGTYDVIIHFHGNPEVTLESVEVAKINAVLVQINGAGKGGYEAIYADHPGVYEELLAAIDRGLKERGIPDPHVHRIALTSWSAGYGAITSILEHRNGTDPLDAVAMFDGIHASWEGGNSRSYAANGIVHDQSDLTPELGLAHQRGAINKLQIRSLLKTAQQAVEGKLYFGITHTEIDPMAYASCTITTNYLLGELGLTRHALDPIADAPKWVDLASMLRVFDTKKIHQLVPLTEVRVGGLHLIGYEGKTPDHHSVQLFQMSQTLLPDIAARWVSN